MAIGVILDFLRFLIIRVDGLERDSVPEAGVVRLGEAEPRSERHATRGPFVGGGFGIPDGHGWVVQRILLERAVGGDDERGDELGGRDVASGDVVPAFFVAAGSDDDAVGVMVGRTMGPVFGLFEDALDDALDEYWELDAADLDGADGSLPDGGDGLFADFRLDEALVDVDVVGGRLLGDLGLLGVHPRMEALIESRRAHAGLRIRNVVAQYLGGLGLGAVEAVSATGLPTLAGNRVGPYHAPSREFLGRRQRVRSAVQDLDAFPCHTNRHLCNMNV